MKKLDRYIEVEVEVEVEKTLAYLDKSENRLKTSPFFFSKLEAKLEHQNRHRWVRLESIPLRSALVSIIGILIVMLNMASAMWILNDKSNMVEMNNDNYLTAFAEEYTSDSYYSSYYTKSATGE